MRRTWQQAAGYAFGLFIGVTLVMAAIFTFVGLLFIVGSFVGLL